MSISIIVAVANNQVIGYENKMPWHLPRDLQYFKRVTTGHSVIMGRKTYESIGKALPNRQNIVISTNVDYYLNDAVVCHSLQEAIVIAQTNQSNDNEVFIIGGASIFSQSINAADKIYLNRVLAEFEGDTFFPELDDKWQLITEETHLADDKNIYDLRFGVYKRIKK